MKDHDIARSTERIQNLVAEQAADWLIRLQDAEANADRAEFARWLTASPTNVAEFLNAKATWEALSGKALSHLPEEGTLLRELSASHAPDVLALHREAAAPADPARESRIYRPRTHRRLAALAAALATVGVGLGAALWIVRFVDPNRATYATDIGEQTMHTLPDGSTIALNTRSRVRLNWSEHARDVHLDAGEALFQVARDPARPFRVWTGDSMIRAVGTRFNVYRAADGIRVTVLEGRVEVTADANADGEAATTSLSGTPAGDVPTSVRDASTARETSTARDTSTMRASRTRRAAPAHIQLTAGEQARIEPSQGIHTTRLAEPDRAVAWQSRRLIFDSAPLAQVIAEFNRYNEIPLRLEDPELAGKRINGIFDATDRASLVAFLEEFEGVRVEARTDAVLVRRAQPE